MSGVGITVKLTVLPAAVVEVWKPVVPKAAKLNDTVPAKEDVTVSGIVARIPDVSTLAFNTAPLPISMQMLPVGLQVMTLAPAVDAAPRIGAPAVIPAGNTKLHCKPTIFAVGEESL